MRFSSLIIKATSVALALATAAVLCSCGAAGSAAPSASVQAAPASAVQEDVPGRYVDSVFPDLAVSQDIQYGTATNEAGKEEKLFLDVYQPKGDKLKSRPAVIFVHGGGFTGGDKVGGIEQQLAIILAHKGYVTLSINYRLRKNPSADYPGTFRDADDDAYAAFQWLLQNRDKYRIDTSHIAFGGHSAGSNIVTDLCYSDWSKKPVPKDGVFAVISMAGPSMVFGSPKKADPFDVIIHGEDDELVPVDGSRQLSARMDSIGTPHLLDIIPGCYHDQSPAIDEVEDVVTSCLYKAMTGKDAGIQIRKYADELKHIVSDRLAGRPTYDAAKVSGVALDGKLDEWGSARPMPLDQLKDAGSSMPDPQDCTAAGYVAWDPSKPSCLYAALTVTDDVFQLHDSASFWENDCLELLVDLSDVGGTVPFQQWVINVDGKTINYIHCDSGNCQVAVQREGHNATFEVMVDLSKSLPEFAGYDLAGKTIGFCLCYDDGEGGSRQHQVGLIAGKTLDPRNFANLKFGE